MAVTTLPNSVDQQKHKRLKKQAATLARIQSTPQSQWLDLLLEHWPQTLPYYVAHRLIEQGHGDIAAEYFDVRNSRTHFNRLDDIAEETLKQLTDDMAIEIYKELRRNNPQVAEGIAPLCGYIASLPQPVQVTVVTSDLPLLMVLQSANLVDHPEEQKMICETRSRASRFWVDGEWNEEQQCHLEGAIVAGLAHKGGVEIRHPLALRVQRPNAQGVMEWVQQEKIYGFSLMKGHIVPLSVQELTNAHCTSPDGQHWPLEPGTHIGHTAKDFGAFLKRKALRRH